MKVEKMQSIVLILDSARGTFIPRDFVTSDFGDIDHEHCKKWNIHPDDALILALGDDYQNNPGYWDSWNTVLNNAFFMNGDDKYTLHQDGDLWGTCYEKMTDTEKQNFGFDVE